MSSDKILKTETTVGDVMGSRYDLLDLKVEQPATAAAKRAKHLEGLTGYVHSIETAGTVDGPGIRFILFTTGCPLRCQYCHNPDTWHLKNGRHVSVDEVMEEIEKYADFLNDAGGGVTISGGEPLFQDKFLANILRRCKGRGIHTALDTSGFLVGRMTRQMLDDTDLVLLDIKSVDPNTYQRVTGVKLEPTLKFARRLSDIGKPIWLRFVLVPDLTDDFDEVESLAEFAATLKSMERVEVLPFHKMGEHKWEALGLKYKLGDTEPPSDKLVSRVQDQFRERGATVF
jgi:pyruvate formate lyase activating enzyme